MIPNYRAPRHEIEQDFLDENPAPADRLNAIVVGPAYVHADLVSGNTVKSTFTLSGSYAYQYVDASNILRAKSPTHLVDSSWVALQGSDLWLQLYSKGATGGVAANNAFNAYANDRTGSTLYYKTPDDSGFYNAGSDVPAANFDLGRSVQAGDILRITGDKATVDRKVVTVAGKDIAPAAGEYGYYGAAELAASAEAPVFGVLHSEGTILAADIALATNALAGDDLTDWSRRYGDISPDGGLRLKVELTALTPGDGDTATFQLVLQGRSTAVTAAAGLVSDTDFTFLGETLNVVHGAWTAGETLSFYIDLPSLAETFPLSGGEVTLGANYSFSTAARKVASSVVLEILDVALDGASVKIRLSDTQGLLTPVGKTITGADTISVTYDGVAAGLVVGITADVFANCHNGQRLTASITPPSRSTTVFDKVVLDAPVGDILSVYDGTKDSLKVEAFVTFTGEIEKIQPVSGDTNFTVNEEDVTLEPAVYAPVSGYAIASDTIKPALTGRGNVAVVWRALVPTSANEAPFLVTGSETIINTIGSYDMASELGMGLLSAVKAAGKGVYGLKVGGTDIASWQAAIATLETLKNVYTIAPLTDDEEVLRLFAEHAAKMNQPKIKKFRRVYASVDSPGSYPKFTALPDGSPTTATITVGSGGGYTLVTYGQGGVDLTGLQIFGGDTLRVVSTGAEYVIDYVGNDKTLILKSGPAAPIAAAVAVEVIAADTPANITRYVGQYASRLGAGLEEDRRISCVWADDGIFDTLDGSPVVIPNRFLAAEIAGRRVSLYPQQSMTRQLINTITDAPNMFTRFSEEQLNEMAANGVWIVMQDDPTGNPYCRHQLTTAADGGPLRYEDSAGVIYDFVCFALDDIIEPLIGKRNVVTRTLVEVKNLTLTALQGMTTAPAEDETIGPMLAGFFDRDGNEGTLNVDFDPEFKDSIMLFTEIEVPLTLNNARTKILARTINTAAGASSVILVQ